MKNSKELFNKIALNPEYYQTRDGKKINNNIGGVQMSFHPQFEFPMCIPIFYSEIFNGTIQITLTDDGKFDNVTHEYYIEDGKRKRRVLDKVRESNLDLILIEDQLLTT